MNLSFNTLLFFLTSQIIKVLESHDCKAFFSSSLGDCLTKSKGTIMSRLFFIIKYKVKFEFSPVFNLNSNCI